VEKGILGFVLPSLTMWPGRCRDTRNDSGDDRILGSCLVCKGDCPWRVTYHPCGTPAMMHHRIQIMMHCEFMQLYCMPLIPMSSRPCRCSRGSLVLIEAFGTESSWRTVGLSCVSQYGPCANSRVVLVHAMVDGLEQTSVRRSPDRPGKPPDCVSLGCVKQPGGRLGCCRGIDDSISSPHPGHRGPSCDRLRIAKVCRIFPFTDASVISRPV
jgi:hypothetical protein